ncbi:MAG: hypothetical protein WDW38_005055 [Sanguina aurantia]
MRLDRENKLLWVERVLICEKLECDPSEGNLCGVLEDQLANARRVRQLETLLSSSQAEHDRLATSLATFQSEHDALLDACNVLDSIALDGIRRHSTCCTPQSIPQISPSTLTTLAAIIRAAIKKGDLNHQQSSQQQQNSSQQQRCTRHHSSNTLCPNTVTADSQGSPNDIFFDLMRLRRLSDSVGSESSYGSGSGSGTLATAEQQASVAAQWQDTMNALHNGSRSTPPLPLLPPPSLPISAPGCVPSGLRREARKHGVSAPGVSDCEVQDISGAFSQHAQLQRLDLRHNKLEEGDWVQTLARMSSLQFLHLDGNPVCLTDKHSILFPHLLLTSSGPDGALPGTGKDPELGTSSSSCSDARSRNRLELPPVSATTSPYHCLLDPDLDRLSQRMAAAALNATAAEDPPPLGVEAVAAAGSVTVAHPPAACDSAHALDLGNTASQQSDPLAGQAMQFSTGSLATDGTTASLGPATAAAAAQTTGFPGGGLSSADEASLPPHKLAVVRTARPASSSQGPACDSGLAPLGIVSGHAPGQALGPAPRRPVSMAVAAAAAATADPSPAAAVADAATANNAAAAAAPAAAATAPAAAPAAAPATAVSMDSVALSVDPPALAAHAANDVAFIGTHLPVVAPVGELKAPAAKSKHMQLLVQSLSLSHQQLQQKHSLMSSECRSLRDQVQVSEQGQQHLLAQNARLAQRNERLTEQVGRLEASVQRVTTQAANQVRDLEGQLADSKHGHEQLISRAKAVEQEHLSEGTRPSVSLLDSSPALTQRVEALQHIIRIQEQQLMALAAPESGLITGEDTGGAAAAPAGAPLLRAWREEVQRLVEAGQADEARVGQQRREWLGQVADLQAAFQQAQQLLQLLEHRAADHRAELALAHGSARAAAESLQTEQALTRSLQERVDQSAVASQATMQALACFQRTFNARSVELASAEQRLEGHGLRLAYAIPRLHFARGLQQAGRSHGDRVVQTTRPHPSSPSQQRAHAPHPCPPPYTADATPGGVSGSSTQGAVSGAVAHSLLQRPRGAPASAGPGDKESQLSGGPGGVSGGAGPGGECSSGGEGDAGGRLAAGGRHADAGAGRAAAAAGEADASECVITCNAAMHPG